MNIALIVFGGTGQRIKSNVPKQFIKINNKELVAYTIETFEKHPLVDEIVLITNSDFLNFTKQLAINYRFLKVRHIISGGKSRQESVRIGLNETSYKDDDNILIHDGDRPLVSFEIISQALKILNTKQACCPIIKKEDELKEVSNLGRKILINGESFDVQTPQAFKYKLIKDAHNRLIDKQFSDDISILEALDEKVEMFLGDVYNFKVTLNNDLDYLKELINKNGKEK